MTDYPPLAIYPPLTKCAVCGHIRNDHDMVDRLWCGRCANSGRSKEAWHAFEPVQDDSPHE
jgi:hypothetical protein